MFFGPIYAGCLIDLSSLYPLDLAIRFVLSEVKSLFSAQ